MTDAPPSPAAEPARIPQELYDRIRQVMPIACVDLLVTDPDGRVLLLRRRNEPARGQWWFPGGRVMHGETRRAAAVRKLAEECGVTADVLEEAGTYDVLLPFSDSVPASHGVTTVFRASVRTAPRVTLDRQSEAADWRKPAHWRAENLHPFVRELLASEDSD